MEIRKTRSQWVGTLIAGVAAFAVYTCMYAYRKPFTAAGFSGVRFLNIDYKIWLIIAQTSGYTFSKFFGIRFISELKSGRRIFNIFKLIGISWISLFFFAIVPAPYNIPFLLINGFPLGIIYGLVFSYLEGRQSTEFLGALLATSFIFASGFTQSVGKFLLLQVHVPENWMPFVAGLIFIPPLVFFSWVLGKTPSPTASDISLRTERRPIDKAERKNFLQAFFPGLVMLIITYVMLTIIRDYRSNFASEIWNELGRGHDASVFTKSEIPASILVLVMMSLLIFVNNNMRALIINHFIIVLGFLVSMISTVLFTYGQLSPFWWMTMTGVGLYMGYVPFNCMLFERLIASFKYVSTAGFIIYVADSFGYLGSDAILLIKNFTHPGISWTGFFVNMTYVISFAGVVLTCLSANYFRKKYRNHIPVILNPSYA